MMFIEREYITQQEEMTMNYKRIVCELENETRIRNSKGRSFGCGVHERTVTLFPAELHDKEEIEIYIKTLCNRLDKIEKGMLTIEFTRDSAQLNILDGIRFVRSFYGSYDVRLYDSQSGCYEIVHEGAIKTKTEVKKDMIKFFNDVIKNNELTVYNKYSIR